MATVRSFMAFRGFIFPFRRKFICHSFVRFNQTSAATKPIAPTQFLSPIDEKVVKYIRNCDLKLDDVLAGKLNVDQLQKEQWEYLRTVNSRVQPLLSTISELQEMSCNADLKDLANIDLATTTAQLTEVLQSVKAVCLPVDPTDKMSTILVEISSGAGGEEASLFADELAQMYTCYAQFMKWKCIQVGGDKSDIVGEKGICLQMKGDNAYKFMKFEGGVHRVQRVPVTERMGRLHTSTVSVAVMPEPTEIDIQLNPKEIKMEMVRSTGHGGMNRDHNDTCVRLTHLPTGLVVEAQASRYVEQNRAAAQNRLRMLLYDKERARLLASEQSRRKLQVGTRGRSEKIRTYNMHQDRITDHRIHQSWSRVLNVLVDGSLFNDIITACVKFNEDERLSEILQQYDSENK